MDKRIKSTLLLIFGAVLFVINEAYLKFGTIYSMIVFAIMFILAFMTWISDDSNTK